MFTSSLLDIPRPFIDPITSLVQAVGLFSLAVHRPRCNESLVLCLDSQLRGVHMFEAPELSAATIHHIVCHASTITATSSLVVCSIRMATPIHPDDSRLWSHCKTVLHHAGLLLHDWIVIGHGGLYCPRTLSDEDNPWPHGSTVV